ncbi:MAG: protein translocase subunit SecF [Melioribacteraceae bacterium]|nr:protein translocase subunit SecF [Melioribacteraceae bacterium]
MRIFENTNIDFLGKRKLFYGFSTVLIVLGLLSILVRGLELGIDFKGGTEIALQFEKPIEISEVRDVLSKIELGGVEVKTFGENNGVLIRTELQKVPESAEFEGSVAGWIENYLVKSFSDNSFKILKEDIVGPKVGNELKRDAVLAILFSLVVILLYLGFRFKFVFAIGAVITLFHDVLITLGMFSLLYGVIPGLNTELSISVVAAFLSLVGYSVNDTVVVFDRIRENVKIHKTAPLEENINSAINKTISRTVITSVTTLFTLLVLVIFGGEVLRGFAFALSFGIIIGTYSSIFVSSTFVLEYAKKKGMKIQF